MTDSECQTRLNDIKLDKLTYPTKIRHYLYKDVDKYVMIWEKKKVASDLNTQWKANCSLTSEDFEAEKKECDNLGYQVFDVHEHIDRFIRR